MSAKKIYLKRVYEPLSSDDGNRILVDRLWPRGISKDRAQLDLWLKEIAPSTELRRWFNHDLTKWAELKRRYFAELAENNDAVRIITEEMSRGKVTLLYAAKDEAHNNAAALREFLNQFK